MRPNQQNNNKNRSRGRNNNGGRKHGNPLSRNYESNGPDVKVRGNAAHVAEKYLQLARDAQSSGDSVMAENYLQHAEHYNRIIAAAQAQMQERFPRDERSDNTDRNDYNDRDGYDRDQDEVDSTAVDEPAPVAVVAQVAVPVEQPVIDGSGPQPVIEGTPAEVSLEEEAAAPAGRAPRRRTAARPRRPRRGEAAAEGGDAQRAGEDAPALEASE